MTKEEIFNRAIELFGDISEDKKQRIQNIIKYEYATEQIEYTDEMIKNLVNDAIYDESLFSNFIVPPFSTLDTKQGYWRDRRTLLEEYLGDSCIGREENLTFSANLKFGERDTGTSRFDAVLAEICLKWFGLRGGLTIDPFAGGHIRGTVASLCEQRYIGTDLNKAQIDANVKRNEELQLPNITWRWDDALNIGNYVEDGTADLIFTCPPYGDLEVYTDDPRDLSNMAYEVFIETYTEIISRAEKKLRNNRFAVIVVGDFRSPQGFYRGFTKDTIIAFEKTGMKLYNQLVLLNSITTASFRANNAFRNRKMVKIHQDVLVFYKGDPKEIQNNFPKIDARINVPTKQQAGLF